MFRLFAWRHFPFSRDLAQDEIEQFHRGLVGRKMPSRSYGAAQFCVQRLDGVPRVNGPPHRDGKGEEWDDMLPVSSPTLRDGRVFLAPWPGVELVERLTASVGVFRPIDRLQRGGDGFAVLPCQATPSRQPRHGLSWRAWARHRG